MFRRFRILFNVSVLPTNATVETVAIADGALWYLDERTEYWKTQPKPVPPASELGMKLSRTKTFCGNTKANSTLASTIERPFSAADVHNYRGSSTIQRNPGILRDSNKEKLSGYESGSNERPPPIGKSAEPPKWDSEQKMEKTVSFECCPNDKSEKGRVSETRKTKSQDQVEQPKDNTTTNKSAEVMAIPGNVMSVTET